MKKKVVVIGGGLAGCLLCNELAGQAEVTLLEVGRKDAIYYPSIGFDRKHLAAVPTFCFGGGGTTNLWHNGLIPIRMDDVSDPSFGKVLNEAQAFTDRAAAALYFAHEPYSTACKKVVSEIGDIAARLGVFPDGLDCLIYPKKFKPLTVDPRVGAFYQVARIDFICEGRQLIKVLAICGTETRELAADVVIVAAGALGSPKILSTLMATAGARYESLGTGFIDHPMGFVGKVRFKAEAAEGFRQLSMLDKGSYVSRNALRLKSDCGKYTCAAFLRPALTMDNSLSIYKYKSLLGASSGMARIKNAFSWKIFHPDIIAEIVSHLFGWNIPSKTYNILFIAEQKRGSNRVYYDGDQLRVDWSVSKEELAIYRSLLEKLGGLLTQVADEVNIETLITEDWLWSAAHHSGTTLLGTGDDALIDQDLKLKCCDNVYVCDGSVIQEHSYANTGLTIGQLALRLAERVLNVECK
jgi:hypothetical protein